MASVTARVFNEILLVVIFGGIKFSSGGDFSRYWAIEFAGFVPPGFYTLGGLLLVFARVKDGGTVLSADIVVLAVEGGGVMHAEEIIEQRFVRETR